MSRIVLFFGIALALAVVLSLLWVRPWRQAPRRAETPLAPHHAGMSLRQTFETLPDPSDPETRLRLARRGTEAWVERWRLLAGAQKTLDVSYFILDEDVFGVAFLAHLLVRAGAGVKVRVLLDGQGNKVSREFRGNDYLDELVATGNVELKLHRPLRVRYLEAVARFSLAAALASEHDKLIIADGRRVLTGGRNVADEYFDPPERDPASFIDLDVVIDAEEASRALSRAFEASFGSERARRQDGERLELADKRRELLLAYRAMNGWLEHGVIDRDVEAELAALDLPWAEELRARPELARALQTPPAPEIVAEARVVDSQPRFDDDRGRDAITESLRRLAGAAKRRILIATPYVVLSEEAVAILEAAARRGVEVLIVTNSPISSDNALSQALFLEQWPELMARVPTLRLWVRGDRHTTHAKTMIVDGVLGVVGTYNLDPLSMAVNGEVVVVAWSRGLAERLEGYVGEVIGGGPPSAYEYRIARDGAGRPLRDEDGRVRVAFGPAHHAASDEWRGVRRWQTIVRAAERVGRVDPIF